MKYIHTLRETYDKYVTPYRSMIVFAGLTGHETMTTLEGLIEGNVPKTIVSGLATVFFGLLAYGNHRIYQDSLKCK